MHIKDTKGKVAERIFLIAAALLTAGVLTYLVFLVSTIVDKADLVFDVSRSTDQQVPGFDFERYDRVMGVSSTSVSVPPTPTTSASSSMR